MSNIVDQYRITQEPYYRPVADEVELYEAAYSVRMPMMLKGPTGCGKTRFVEYMAYKLGKPLITVACNEDMTASDLVGRFLLSASGTEWQDGPLAIAARHGAICYLDEVVEARQDTTVVIHPLTDNRRVLPLEKKGELVNAHPDFQIVISYNPGYQSLMKDLKQSTKQRFGGLDFTYPEHAIETEIVAHESGVAADIAGKDAHLGLVELEPARDRRADIELRLSRGVNDETSLVVDETERATWLHGAGGHARHVRLQGDDLVRGCTGLVEGVLVPLLPKVGDVVRYFVPHRRCAARERRADIGDGVEGIIVDLDQLAGRFRLLGRLRDDEGDAFADVPHPITGKHGPLGLECLLSV